MARWRTPRLSPNLVAYPESRHFGVCAIASAELRREDAQIKPTGTGT